MVVLVHGGYWQQGYDRSIMNKLAEDLNRLGYTTWNLDYRRVGDPGGGWPGTFDDVAAGIDHVRALADDYPIDLARVAVVGHSAGGQLAIWAASRSTLPAGSPGIGPAVSPAVVVSLAGVLDMETAATATDAAGSAELRSSTVAVVGGTPTQVPERYEIVSPLRRIPVSVPQLLVHGDNDTTVPISQSQTYERAAVAAGTPATLISVPGAEHFDVMAVGSTGWDATRDFLRDQLGPAYSTT
jgi:acetyl esterase/lipase